MLNDKDNKGVFQLANRIYNSLEDQTSKKLFSLRMMYNLTSDVNYILDMAMSIPEFNNAKLGNIGKVFSILREFESSKKLIIYGAGQFGKGIFELLSDLSWFGFCDQDTNKQHVTYCGLPVISPEDLVNKYPDAYVIIGTKKYHNEAYDKLLSLGLSKDNIFNDYIEFELCLSNKQYFEESIMIPQDNEIFVDAGCFNCDTSLLFKEWSNGNYKKIYAFEPDPSNFKNCNTIIRNTSLTNIELINAGLWSEDSILRFNAEGSSASSFSDTGSLNIEVVSLDNVLKGERASFIKMDIEGFELEALKGAQKTITTYRPRLAICIYHKPEDILEIPLYLQSLVPDYKFYIRHYSNYTIETVLYAV